MRQHGDAACLVDKFNGISRRHLEFGDPGWTILLQESLKRFVQGGAMTSLDQGAGDMRATRCAAIGQSEYHVGLQGHANRLQTSDHFANPVLADGLKPGNLGQEAWILGIKEVAEKMQFVAV